MIKMQYVNFIKDGNKYIIHNIIYNQNVGEIKKERLGTWMHWQLFSYSPEIGFSNGCLKEISAFITTLYKKRKG